MTITLFITFMTAAAEVSGLLTEAIKKAYQNAGRKYSANVLPLINAAVIGGLGMAALYMLLGIPWTVNNIICLVIMIVAVWIGSMIGYDKIIQLLKQIQETEAKAERGAENGNENQ